LLKNIYIISISSIYKIQSRLSEAAGVLHKGTILRLARIVMMLQYSLVETQRHAAESRGINTCARWLLRTRKDPRHAVRVSENISCTGVASGL